MGITARLTLVSTVVLGVVVAAAAITLVKTLEARLRTAADQGLLARAELLLPGPGGGSTRLTGTAPLLESDESFVQVLAADGAVEESSSGLPSVALIEPSALAGLENRKFFSRRIRIEDELEPVRLLAVAMPPGRRYLVVGSSQEDQVEAVEALKDRLAIGGPAIVVLGGLILGWVTNAALRPVDRLRTEADAVSASGEDRRLTVPGSRDEIARLAESFNSLLARRNEALRRERQFVDQASHELRTPVAKLVAELELALQGPADPEQLRAAVQAALGDAGDLSRLSNDLLVLARSNRGSLPVQPEMVYLNEVLDAAVESMSAEIEGARLTVVNRLEGAWWMDPLRLRQVFVNLLQNAQRYAGPGCTVEFMCRQVPTGLEIVAQDDGPGFPEDLLRHPAEPFDRSATARAQGSGPGLGLAIVKAIVESSGGRVEFVNAPVGGARATAFFPRRDPDPPS